MVAVSVACVVLAFAAMFRRSTVAPPTDHTPSSIIPEGSLTMAQAAANIAEDQKSAE